MIKTTELRIGNLIQHSAYGIFQVEVIARDWNAVHFKSFPEGREYTHLGEELPEGAVGDWHGIELTEKWLLNFGFELQYKTPFFEWVARKGGFNISNEEVEAGYNRQGKFLPPIKYVHQLQNLYFSLTYTELKLK